MKLRVGINNTLKKSYSKNNLFKKHTETGKNIPYGLYQ